MGLICIYIYIVYTSCRYILFPQLYIYSYTVLYIILYIRISIYFCILNCGLFTENVRDTFWTFFGGAMQHEIDRMYLCNIYIYIERENL